MTGGRARARLISPRTGAAAVTLAVILAVVAVVGVRAWRDTHRSELERALDLAPKDAARYSWTDWAGVRTALDVSGTGASADEELVNDGYDADLTPGSSLTSSADEIREAYGFSPATLSWELLSQSTEGAALLMRVSDSVSFDTIRKHLTDAGFAPPSSGTGVWDGGTLGSTGSLPILGFAALDEDAHLVVTSDSDAYLSSVMERRGEGEVPPPIGQVAAAVGSPLSAELYDGDYTCSHLAMANADATDRAQGDQLIAQAGAVSPVLAFAMARVGRVVRVAMAFADHGQAKVNATTRAKLAQGEAPGQGGTFTDRFGLGEVAARGSVVTMDLHPVDDAPVLSDLSTGPLLFATC